MNASTTTLDRLMRVIVTRLELVSTVAAAKLDSERSSTKPESREPNGSPSPHLHYTRRYAGCNTDIQRRAVITDALDELRQLKYSRRPDVDKTTIDGRHAIGRDQRPAYIVAYVYGYSQRHIHRLRAEVRSIRDTGKLT